MAWRPGRLWPAAGLLVALSVVLTWLWRHPLPTDSGTAPAVASLPPQASAVPISATQANDFRTGMERLPSSLRGTRVPALQVDAEGALVVNEALRDVFDYFLSAIGEEDLATLTARLRAYLSHQLPPAAAMRALALLEDYLAYRHALADIPDAGGSAASLDLVALAQQQAQVRALRQAHLDSATVAAFFGREQTFNDYMLARARVRQDASLDAQQRATQLAQLRAGLPAPLRDSVEDVRRYPTLRALTREWQQQDGSAAALRTLREQTVGPAAADRLEALDSERAVFDARVGQWLLQRDAILTDDSLSPVDREAQVQALRAQAFSDTEQVRVQTLERLHDNAEGL